MPVEILDNVTAVGDDVFSQTVAGPGRVSMWCVKNGAQRYGFKSADQIMQHGVPFGHGDRRVVKGWIPATIGNGKDKRENIVKGPLGIEYVELHVDEEAMIEKQKFEGQVSNDAVRNAQGASPIKNESVDELGNSLLRAKVTTNSDSIQRISDDEIDRLAEDRLKKITAEHP